MPLVDLLSMLGRRSGLNWPLEQMLLSVITIHDELASYNSLLPDPRTRFQVAALEKSGGVGEL